jgi:hypothetical protein
MRVGRQVIDGGVTASKHITFWSSSRRTLGSVRSTLLCREEVASKFKELTSPSLIRIVECRQSKSRVNRCIDPNVDICKSEWLGLGESERL